MEVDVVDVKIDPTRHNNSNVWKKGGPTYCGSDHSSSAAVPITQRRRGGVVISKYLRTVRRLQHDQFSTNVATVIPPANLGTIHNVPYR
jgi:hypothetical protein